MTTVADVMTRKPFALLAAATVASALEAMRERGISSVLVFLLPGSAEWGIVTMRDIVAQVITESLDAGTVRLGEIATWRLLTAQPGWTLQQAAEVMAQAKIRRLPVVDREEIIGIVSDTDIFTSLIPRQDWDHMRQVRKERALQRVSQTSPARTVADVMSSPVLTIDPTAMVDRAAAKMISAGISSLLVTPDARHPQGIITKRDIVTKLIAGGQDPRSIAVERLMSSPVFTVEPDVTLQGCSSRMAAFRVRRFPVVDRDGDIIGIVSDSDVLAATAALRWAGHRKGPTSAIVADIMRPTAAGPQPARGDAVAPEVSLWECADRLARAGVREFQVVQGGRIIGLVGDVDIIRAITERGGAH
jgi:CBS domain-containing protein